MCKISFKLHIPFSTEDSDDFLIFYRTISKFQLFYNFGFSPDEQRRREFEENETVQRMICNLISGISNRKEVPAEIYETLKNAVQRFTPFTCPENHEIYSDTALRCCAYCLYGEWMLLKAAKSSLDMDNFMSGCVDFSKNFFFHMWADGGFLPLDEYL